MYRVFAIAPYEGLKTLIMSIAPEYPNLEVRCEVSNLSEGRDLVRRAIEQDYDVFLSRGGTADYIRSTSTIPVVEINVSGYDVLYSIAITQNYSGRKVVVGYGQVTRGYESICKLLHYNVDIYTINSEDELHRTLYQLSGQDVSVVIGDVITMQFARQIGMNCMLITSGEDSVRDAFKQICLIERCTGHAQRNLQIIKSLFEGAQAYACVMDAEGKTDYSRFPEGVDVPALKDALAGRSEALLKSGRETLLFRGASGIGVWADGSVIKPSAEEKLFAWKLRLEGEAERRLPKGVEMQNSDEIAVISPSMFASQNKVYRSMLKQIDVLGRSGSSILLEGERGLGKARLGHMIYQMDGHLPLISVDCTCAGADVMEALEATAEAHEGKRFTVFWRHLDCLGAEAQGAMLARRKSLARFRHIATAERNMIDMVASGHMDEQLYEEFRFARVFIPPLRDRPEDLDDLISLLIGEIDAKIGKQIAGVTRSAAECIRKYEWFGNEIQLRDVLERAMIMTDEPYIQKKTIESLLSAQKNNINSYGITEGMTLDFIEKEIIQYVLRAENMNQVKAAQRLGISRTTLWRKIK